MKKKFIKTFIILLIAVVFSTVNNFCFQGLFSLINSAQAAPLENKQNVNKKVAMTDDCGETQANVSEEATVVPVVVLNSQNNLFPALPQNNNNSLLPCCLDGGHPSIVSLTQFLDFGKIMPIILFTEKKIPENKASIIVYPEPILSPPKLLALKTTILRL